MLQKKRLSLVRSVIPIAVDISQIQNWFFRGVEAVVLAKFGVRKRSEGIQVIRVYFIAAVDRLSIFGRLVVVDRDTLGWQVV